MANVSARGANSPNPHRESSIRQILSWVPVKSLMRFKAVSKRWNSVIVDPSFARLYRGGFRGLLFSTSNLDGAVHLAPPRDFAYLKIDGTTGQFSHQLTLDVSFRTTEAVNGLMCLYRGNDSYVLNVATHELVKLAVSRISCKLPTYHFGFDPVNSLYKLLKICPVYEDEDRGTDYVFVRHLGCEILTLGVDSSWRSIDPPMEAIIDHSICVNGVLYWMEVETIYSRGRHLIAFHLADEKFSDIKIPPPFYFGLPKFGTIGLIIRAMYCGGRDYKRFEIRHYRSGTWTDVHAMRLKYEIPEVELVGILPNGKLIFVNMESYYPVPCYLYDETSGVVEEIVVNQTQPNFRGDLWDVSYHEETVLSLHHLIAAASD